MLFPYYEITLGMPTSVNRSREVGKNKKGGYIVRSSEYESWLQYAAIEFRNQFPFGVSEKFKGRLRVDYIFCWTADSPGRLSSDISNREKALSDFLEKKFFENDNQIDEQHHYRRIIPSGHNHVLVRIYEIDDRRFRKPGLIWSPALETTPALGVEK